MHKIPPTVANKAKVIMFQCNLLIINKVVFVIPLSSLCSFSFYGSAEQIYLFCAHLNCNTDKMGFVARRCLAHLKVPIEIEK